MWNITRAQGNKGWPRVAIVIVHYNGAALIRMCLKSLRLTDYPGFKVFVFDNGSTDGSGDIARREFPEATVFAVEKNMGLTRAANRAFQLAMEAYPCDYVAFLNNDIEAISPDWLSRMAEAAEKTHGVGIVGCKLLYPDRTIQHAGEIFWPDRLRGKGEPPGRYGQTEILDAVTFAASLISTKAMEKIGIFDEVFSPFYYEDVDFCFRAKKAGIRSLYLGGVTLIHHEGGSMKMDSVREYTIARNAIIFYARYAPLFELLKMMGRIYARLIIRRADKRKDFGKGNMALQLSPIELVRLPYRILLMSAAIAAGLLSSRTHKVAPARPVKTGGKPG